ncbi:MAG: multidrug efflux SMR transporter [Prevotellaceae bacterium]|jgi:small multidrug resistance pump|nr:multidrug efflux SMR transporter [Prevotellaceae bacterium]
MQPKAVIFLILAIIFETVGTTFMKSSEQFTKLVPSVIMVIAYIACFYCLSIPIKTVPVGIVYAIWSAVGIVLITVVSAVVFKQIPDTPAITGCILIVAGVVIINVFSKTIGH